MENVKTKHSLHIEAEAIVASGVAAVLEFSDKTLELKLDDRILTLFGSNFNVTSLDLESGRLTADGKVESLKYGAKREARSFFKKLLK